MIPRDEHTAHDAEVDTLTNILMRLGRADSTGRKWLRSLQAKHPADPFPLPIGKRNVVYDLFIVADVMAWVDRVAPCPVRTFNRLAQRFIRGEFDRPDLQQQYKLKRIASKLCRRAA